jgi:leader peptidase (prepilin peptidase)/N-methyltransferase
MRPAGAFGAAIGGGLLFLVAGIRLEADGSELARLSILGAALGGVVASDLAERHIPNRIVLPAAAACSIFLSVDGVRPADLLGGLAVVASMLGLSLVRPASFGMGDVKLSLLLVLGLGSLATQALLLGLVLAAVFGGLLLLRYGHPATARSLPLAPFLCSGAAVAVLL